MNVAVHAIHAAWSPEPAPEIDSAPRDPRDDGATPLVTVVTICLNRAATIGRTIASVRAQTYPNIEYIVLDGGSTDGTIDVIRANADAIDFWRSARDGGLYNALNEGVRRARGRFVQFVHSDDWLEPDQIERAVAAATTVYADIVHGDLAMHREDGTRWERRGRADWFPLVVAEIPQILHPTVLARRRAFETVGLFRTDLRIAADVDWFLRAAHADLVFRHDPAVRSNMTEGGISTRRQRLALAEFAAILSREPVRRTALVLGALWLLGTTLPVAGPALGVLRGIRARLLNALARMRRLGWRLGVSIIRRTPLRDPARALLVRIQGGRRVPAQGAPRLLTRFAELRHADPAADDAELLARAKRDILGPR
jgi:glycosyltransferase involved in cell wall biosynthesis